MESSLSIAYDELASEVGHFLGYTRGETKGEREWSAQQKNDIESCLKAGYHQFLFPPCLPGEMTPHSWSFLRPTVSLSLTSGEQSLKLPDDFAFFEGQVTIQSSSTVYTPIQQVGEQTIRASYAMSPTATGRPLMFAVRPRRGTEVGKGQRMDLYVYPEADANYTLQATYCLLPDALKTPKPYPLGGAQHAQTVLESCLAIAEDRLDDARTVHTSKFMERLFASVGMDRKNKAQFIGKNLDMSDCPTGFRRRDDGIVVTYNGSSYT